MAQSASTSQPEQNTRLMTGVELPPIRNINEFLLETNRYERPPFNDFKRWNNRIISNLLHFQTNYFACFVVLFLFQTFLNSQDVFFGLIAIVAVVGTLVFSISPDPTLKKLRTDHPLITLGGIIVVAYAFISALNSVFVVVFAVLFPVLLVLIHASLRLRGIANRVSNVSERFGIRTTLMGQILERTGLSVQV